MTGWTTDPYATLSLIAAIVSLGAFSAGLEGLALWRSGAYGTGGVWAWPLLRTVGTRTLFHMVPDHFGDGAVLALIVGRIAASVALIACVVLGLAQTLPLMVLVVTHIVLQRRSLWGGEGGDQMMLIVFVVALIATLGGGGNAITTACVLFVAGQITLAYVASGTAKCFGPLWRQGKALGKVMNHYTYGHAGLAGFLGTRPKLARLICYGVIGFQLSFPVFLLLPMPWALAYLVGGLLFHTGIALAMRLNLFLPAFLGTYPSLLFAHELLWRR